MKRSAIAFAVLASVALAACSSEEGDGGATGGSAGAAGQGGGGTAGQPSGGTAGISSGGASGNAGSAGASSTGGIAGAAGAAGAGGSAGSGQDADGDGLDDAEELAIATSYFPYYSVDPADQCPRHGVLFRVTPHPEDASKLAIWYVVLFEKDCGAGGHVGDDEVFGALVDAKLPPPGGLLALRAISHQGTLCEQKTTCGTLPGCSACTTQPKNGKPTYLVFASVNKHGTYVHEGKCDLSIVCDFGGCSLNPTPSAAPFQNAGEPVKPLTNDLTTNGFITSANGWTEPSLMNFDPWGQTDFGGAGNVADDLQDAAFLISPSGC